MRFCLLDAALVLGGGALYAAAFPPYGCDAAAWVALVPLLAVVRRAGRGAAFVAGAAYGAVFFAAIVPWVVEAVAAYFGAGVVAAVAIGAAICVLFVSGYLGLFALAARRLLRRGRWHAFIGIPALWVAYELARTTILTGLPWELLGHSQWRRIALIQVADVGGVYGLSFVIAAVNVGLYLGVRTAACTARPSRLARGATPLATALTLVAICAGYGTWRLASAEQPGRSAVLALAQANLPTRWQWERSTAQRDLLAYLELSRHALAQSHPDLLVWPEYALTLYPQRDVQVLPALRDVASRTAGGLVFGAPRLDGDPPHARYFNAAYHLAPAGTLAIYDKIHLVPFAEYRPAALGEALAADGDADFSAGDASTVFETAVGRLGVLICYEVIFPDLARRLTRAGAEILLNLSNDGWLDRAGLGAGAQHLSIAVFRAVENHRVVARAAASGISGFIDPFGRPYGLVAAGTSGIATGEVTPRRDLSVYTRVGDVFAWACAALGLALLLTPRRSTRLASGAPRSPADAPRT
jgi:apolipoprotein N-acyltransferase